MLRPRLDHLKDRHLRLLVLLSEEKQLGKAAVRLGISQPAASKTLVDIEERVGCNLFVRGSQETTPTEQGEILIGYARHCLGETKRVADEIEAVNARKTRMLRVGMLASSAITVVPRAIDELVRLDPAIELSLDESVLPQLVEKLRASEIDLFVGRIDIAVPRDEFEEIFLFEEPLTIVCRAQHPILQISRPQLSDTLSYPWILPLRTTLMRSKVEEMFHAHSLACPRQAIESNSLVANLAILHGSDRLCAISQNAARRGIEQGFLASLPIDTKVYPGAIGIVLRRNETHLDAVLKFVNVLKSFYQVDSR